VWESNKMRRASSVYLGLLGILVFDSPLALIAAFPPSNGIAAALWMAPIEARCERHVSPHSI